MTDRRDVLTALAAGAATIPAAGLGAPIVPPPHARKDGACCAATEDAYFPNVPVEAHNGQRALFYNDLLRDKLVLVNFMSIANDEHYPVTDNLVRVQKELGDRIGRDVFMYSVTVDPENDSSADLRDFAASKGVGTGWLFLTGKPRDMEMIKGRFFVHRGGGGHHHHGDHGKPHDCSMGLVRYGNDAVGVWGAVAAKADPVQIAERITWITPRPAVTGKPRRRGPTPIVRQPDTVPVAKS